MKVSFLGAGSVGFNQTLVRDILKVKKLQNIEISLHDISRSNLLMVAELIQKDIKANNLPTKLSIDPIRKESIKNAKYIISCVRVGGLEAFETDISIPLKYGIDQCVGDTICAGGIMYGQRNIPVILDFCKDIKKYAKKNALFLNYANPMAMNTWAANEIGKVNTIGLCHGVQGGAKLIEDSLNIPSGKMKYSCSGINHMTWYLDLKYKGKKITKEQLSKSLKKHKKFSRDEKVRIDVLDKFGYFSTESNGHLSEYLPWYRRTQKDVRKWSSLSNWIHGETGGYLRVCNEKRNWFVEDYPKYLKNSGIQLKDYKRSTEHGSYIIEAIETGKKYRGHFNVINKKIISNLDDDCVIESTGYVDSKGIKMIEGVTLPLQCASLCSTSVDVQRMAVKAAIKGDIELLKLAVLQDPLVSSVCSSEEVWQMVDEMLVAQAQWLPQYQSKINSIKKNLKKIKNYKYNKSIKGLTKKTRHNQQKRSVLVEKEAFNL